MLNISIKSQDEEVREVGLLGMRRNAAVVVKSVRPLLTLIAVRHE